MCVLALGFVRGTAGTVQAVPGRTDTEACAHAYNPVTGEPHAAHEAQHLAGLQDQRKRPGHGSPRGGGAKRRGWCLRAMGFASSLSGSSHRSVEGRQPQTEWAKRWSRKDETKNSQRFVY